MQDDWAHAATKLKLEDREKLSNVRLRLASNQTVEGKVFELRSGKVCGFERVDVERLISGFNDAFSRPGDMTWTITRMTPEMQITAPNGYQREFFRIEWRVETRPGESIVGKSVAQGAGVNIKWRNNERALAHDANIAFAEAVLNLIVESYNQTLVEKR